MTLHKSATLLATLLVVSAMAWTFALAAGATRPTIAHYNHIFVIIGENKGFAQIMDHPKWTPNLHQLAAQYGLASQFYSEVHSSEGNYIALVGGDTFGIHDDDAFFCKPGPKSEFCEDSEHPHYVDHTIHARSLMDQLAARNMTWKGYYEDLPAPGTLMPRWPTPSYPVKGLPYELYAAKHNAFINFADVNNAPYTERMRHFANFRQLDDDLKSDHLPNYAHIIPDQCNEMHGLAPDDSAIIPPGCDEHKDLRQVVERGDAEMAMLVRKIIASKVWRDPGNTAIVITFDENNEEARKTGKQGCCGYDPHSLANFGGGHIVTIVITNHGPRHVVDPTPYNHYSLLRTTEDAFGIHRYLGHAADTANGVVSMSPLFVVAR